MAKHACLILLLVVLASCMHQGRIQIDDPVPGTLLVTGASVPASGATFQNFSLVGVLQGSGVPPRRVTMEGMVRTSQHPSAGQTLPVTISRSDPTWFRIEWDQVRTGAEEAVAEADRIAASMRGEPVGEISLSPALQYTARLPDELRGLRVALRIRGESDTQGLESCREMAMLRAHRIGWDVVRAGHEDITMEILCDEGLGLHLGEGKLRLIGVSPDAVTRLLVANREVAVVRPPVTLFRCPADDRGRTPVEPCLLRLMVFLDGLLIKAATDSAALREALRARNHSPTETE